MKSFHEGFLYDCQWSKFIVVPSGKLPGGFADVQMTLVVVPVLVPGSCGVSSPSGPCRRHELSMVMFSGL